MPESITNRLPDRYNPRMSQRASPTSSVFATPVVSLMQPSGTNPVSRSTPQWAEDLGLEDLLHAFNVSHRHAAFIRQVLTALITDPAVIRWRQAVFNDFVQNPGLVKRLNNLLPRLTELRMGNPLLGTRKRSILLETADRLGELSLYLSVVQELVDALGKAELRSDALRTLGENLLAISRDEQFQHLRAQLPELQAPLHNIRSL